MAWRIPGSLVLLFCLFPSFVPAAAINFEGLVDGELVTTQIPGLTFTNTVAFAAGITLNEFEFPPRSGSIVVSDSGGPIDIMFATPVTSFAGYFTYLVPVTVTAFDALGNPLASTTSLFSANLALSGDSGSSPSELLSVAGAGIVRVTIAGDSAGGSFTLDDAQYTGAAIPEPSSLVLSVTGLAAAILLRRTNQFTQKQ